VVLDRFWHGEHQSILELLAGYLWRNSTPGSVLSIITERPESELPHMIARMLDEHLLPAALRRLHDLAPLASLAGMAAPSLPAGIAAPAAVSVPPTTTTPEVQRRLSLILAASSSDLEQVLTHALAYASVDSPWAQRAAAEILETCRRPSVEALIDYMQVGDGKSDQSRRVAAQLETILTWIDGPSELLSTAAREFFSEFTLTRLLEVVRKWPVPLSSVLARVVARAQVEIVPQLLKVLASPAPQRRLLALQAIELLDVSSEVTAQLLPLVSDPRVEVRVRAIDLLSALASPQLMTMLPTLLLDATTDVQDAAVRALRRAQRKRRPAPGPSSFTNANVGLLPQQSTP
jgi:hypothetical protein